MDEHFLKRYAILSFANNDFFNIGVIFTISTCERVRDRPV